MGLFGSLFGQPQQPTTAAPANPYSDPGFTLQKALEFATGGYGALDRQRDLNVHARQWQANQDLAKAASPQPTGQFVSPPGNGQTDPSQIAPPQQIMGTKAPTPLDLINSGALQRAQAQGADTKGYLDTYNTANPAYAIDQTPQTYQTGNGQLTRVQNGQASVIKNTSPQLIQGTNPLTGQPYARWEAPPTTAPVDGSAPPAPPTSQQQAAPPMLPGNMKSFRDPGYDAVEQQVAQQVGIDPSLLKSIRVNGEKSNADQVSSAGAQSVYQITPQTRQGILQKYGVDAYAGPTQAATAAALLLRDNLAATNNNTSKAVQMYVAGTDPKAFGPVSQAYVQRVMGGYQPTQQGGTSAPPQVGQPPQSLAPGQSQPIDLGFGDPNASVPGDPTKTGDDYLKSLPSAIAARVQALSQGREAPLTAQIQKTPFGHALASALYQYDPNYDESDAKARNGVFQSYTHGADAKNIKSINTAIEHLGDLSDSVESLGNNDVPWLLGVGTNYVHSLDPSFQDKRNKVAIDADHSMQEVNRAFKQGALTNADASESAKTFSPDSARVVQRGAIAANAELLLGRLSAMSDTFQTGTGQTPPTGTFLSPKAIAVLHKIYGRHQEEVPPEVAQASSPDNFQIQRAPTAQPSMPPMKTASNVEQWGRDKAGKLIRLQ